MNCMFLVRLLMILVYVTVTRLSDPVVPRHSDAVSRLSNPDSLCTLLSGTWTFYKFY